MDLLSIAARLGGAALKSIPGVGAVTEILDFVNDILPKDKQLNENSTGSDTIKAIQGLPPNDQSKVLEKQFDVEIAEIKADVDKFQAMADVDKSGNTTRPWIAKLYAWNTVIVSDLMICGVVYAIYKNQMTVENSWPLVLAILTPFAVIVRQYFGLRTVEKQQKYEAATGTPPSPVVGLLGNVVKRFTKG